MQATILGIIQGITEFLPISSSGHLIFIPKWFGWPDQGLSFDAVVHVGTLLAVVVYFRKRLWNVFLSFFRKGNEYQDNRRLGFLLILSIIPAGLAGLFGKDWIEGNLRSPEIIAYGLIGWGILLGVADWMAKKQMQKKTTEHVGWKETLFIGCAQAIALIPGTSRSGITMTAGLFANLNKKTAAEFSFLMSVPIIALAGGLKIFELIRYGATEVSLLVLCVGFVVSALSGLVAIAGLMKIIEKWSFMPFVVYRIVVGCGILMFLV